MLSILPKKRKRALWKIFTHCQSYQMMDATKLLLKLPYGPSVRLVGWLVGLSQFSRREQCYTSMLLSEHLFTLLQHVTLVGRHYLNTYFENSSGNGCRTPCWIAEYAKPPLILSVVLMWHLKWWRRPDIGHHVETNIFCKDKITATFSGFKVKYL